MNDLMTLSKYEIQGGFLSEQQSDQIQADIYEMLKTLR